MFLKYIYIDLEKLLMIKFIATSKQRERKNILLIKISKLQFDKQQYGLMNIGLLNINVIQNYILIVYFTSLDKPMSTSGYNTAGCTL